VRAAGGIVGELDEVAETGVGEAFAESSQVGHGHVEVGADLGEEHVDGILVHGR
jgi:hypothetical protein